MSFYIVLWTKIGDTYFLVSAESHLKGTEISFEKNRSFSFEANIFETIGDRKKFSTMKIEWLQELLPRSRFTPSRYIDIDPHLYYDLDPFCTAAHYLLLYNVYLRSHAFSLNRAFTHQVWLTLVGPTSVYPYGIDKKIKRIINYKLQKNEYNSER